MIFPTAGAVRKRLETLLNDKMVLWVAGFISDISDKEIAWNIALMSQIIIFWEKGLLTSDYVVSS